MEKLDLDTKKLFIETYNWYIKNMSKMSGHQRTAWMHLLNGQFGVLKGKNDIKTNN